MSLYAAIDLHSSNSVLAVMDGEGKSLLQCRRPNDLPRILADLAPYQSDLAGIAVESTYNWYWLVDGLMDQGYAVHLVNTTAIPQYDGLKHGDDHSDALHLAQLMRLGLLPEGYIYPREQRATRDLLRRRFALVRQAVQLMLSIQSSFSRSTGKQLSGNALRQLTPTQLEALFPDLATRYGVLIQFKLWLTLQEQISALEHWVRKDLLRPDLLMRLQSVPGIGPILSMTILLESGAIERFASVGDYASYRNTETGRNRGQSTLSDPRHRLTPLLLRDATCHPAGHKKPKNRVRAPFLRDGFRNRGQSTFFEQVAGQLHAASTSSLT